MGEEDMNEEGREEMPDLYRTSALGMYVNFASDNDLMICSLVMAFQVWRSKLLFSADVGNT